MKGKMKKICTVVLALCMAGVMVTGCGQTQPTSDDEVAKTEEIVIGISLPSKELARCLKDEEYITAELDELGYGYDVQFGEGDAAKQVSQIENMMTSGVDILVISPWDGSSMTQICERAHELGIPVIAYDALILNSEYIECYMADDLKKIGATQAQYIVDKLGVAKGKGPFNLEIVAGDPADSNATYFYDGAMEVLQPYIDDGSLVVQSGQISFSETATPGWDATKAQSRMDALISSYYTEKHLDAVLCSNDGVAIGSISALKSAGYGTSDTPYPVTTGQDCDIASIQSIINEEQTMTVFKDIRMLAANTAYVVDCLVKGEEPEFSDTIFNNGVMDVPALVVEPQALDIENYKELLLDSGYYSESDLH